MNIGKTLFAQVMDFLPWSTFTRIVARYDGDRRVRTLACAEQYRAQGRVSRRRNPPNCIGEMADYASLIRPTIHRVCCS